MKKLFSSSIAVLCSIVSMHAQFSAVTNTYTLQDKDVTVANGVITACSTTATDWGTGKLIIPETLKGQKITAIAGIAQRNIYTSGVFDGKRVGKITSISFPTSLVSIGGYAFAQNEIVDLALPDNIKYLGEGAFYGSSKLETLVISRGIDTLRGSMFDHAPLKTLTIPKNIVCLSGTGGFYGCALESVLFEEGSKLSYIGGRVFEACTKLKNISLPTRLGYIEGAALSLCDLDTIVIPDSVTYIGSGAFLGNNLDTVVIPNRVTQIGASAFGGNNISSIALPSPVIKEGYVFTGWKDQNGTVVTKIKNLSLSYEAQFVKASDKYSTISGTISIDNATSVQYNISGDTTATNLTNSNGSFSCYIRKGLNITITPVKQGYTFTPASKTITAIQANVSDVQFAASKVTDIENTSNGTLRLYPTSATDKVSIIGAEVVESVVILNSLGVIVASYHNIQDGFSVSQLNSGFYTVSIRANNQTTNHQLIVE